jgi:hypothetical protein
MKKTEYSRLSRGGLGGVHGSFATLLIGRGSASTRFMRTIESPIQTRNLHNI